MCANKVHFKNVIVDMYIFAFKNTNPKIGRGLHLKTFIDFQPTVYPEGNRKEIL